MTISRRGFLTGCVSVGGMALAGCAQSPQVHRQRWYLFGTLVDVTVVHPDAPRVARAMGLLSARLRDMHRNLHAWKPGALMDINQALAQGEVVEVSAEMSALIADLQACHRDSAGIFNPALGELIGLWGFHDDVLPTGAPPAPRQIERLLATAPSPSDLRLDAGRLTAGNPHVQLDLGGYGKGYALDMGMRVLRDAGIADATINAGGDLNVAGRNGRDAWRVGVRNPQGPGALAWLETDGQEAIYTSGNYERYLEYQGRRYAHILDPRTGMPARDIVSATVIHRQGARADAAATALTVAGPSGWQAVAEAMGIHQVMVVERSGRIVMTRSMAERVSLDRRGKRELVVV